MRRGHLLLCVALACFTALLRASYHLPVDSERPFPDTLGRMTNLVDGLGATAFSYTSFGGLQSEDGPWSGDKTSVSHDANGNLLSDGWRSFEYDAENHFTDVYVSGQWRSDFQYEYDGLGRKRVQRDYAWTGSA